MSRLGSKSRGPIRVTGKHSAAQGIVNASAGSLAAHHRDMLERESGIAPKVVEARGCRTVHKKAELERLGFGRAQRNVPGLLFPLHGPAGGIALYQLRPDEPRIKDDGPAKYETPGGSRMMLDVHPFAREKLSDPSVPLFVTE